MLSKTFGLSSLVAFLSLLCPAYWAHASEVYLLGGQQVLLYKIINWWYFAPADQAAHLCGESITYRSSGETQIRVLPNGSTMEISLNQGCAPLLALVGQGGAHLAKTSVEALWMNEEYLTSKKATLTIEELAHTNNCSIAIENVQHEQQDNLLGHQSLLTLSVTGSVQGLMDGKIALNPSSDLLEKCSATINESTPAGSPILMVTLSENGPPLLKFTLSSK